MLSGVQILNFNVEEFRARIHKFSDEKLREYVEAARYMCSPKGNFGKPPMPAHAIQLEECTAEWRRRFPRPEGRSENVQTARETG
jgi:hypothetical protein